MGEIRGGDELGVPHRPGPAARHVARRHVAGLDDRQRRDQLCLEEPATAGIVGQRSQCLDDGNVASERAIGAFQPPDCGNDFLFDPVLCLDPFQKPTVAPKRAR